MKYSSAVLLIVNGSALINFLYVLITNDGLLDDSFNGLYGRSGLSMHTLSIVNFIYFVYYINIEKYKKSTLFFISGFLCFYGLGLIIFVTSLLLVIMKYINKKYIKYILISPILIVLIYFSAKEVNPTIFSYMNKNITRVLNVVVNKKDYASEMKDVLNLETVKTPRKIMSYEGAIRLLFSEPTVLLVGTSPGTYNSRTSFLLNGEYSSNPLFKFIEVRSPHAEQYVYPLWNRNITFQYNDGTRNQPFSSFVALLVEYGFFPLLLFSILFYNSYVRASKRNNHLKLFVSFIFVFFIMNLITDNYMEYPEFSFLFILILKSLESSGIKKA